MHWLGSLLSRSLDSICNLWESAASRVAYPSAKMKHRDFKLLFDAGVLTGVVATPNAQGKGWHLDIHMAKPVLDGHRGDLEANRSIWQRFQPRRFASLGPDE